MIKFLESNQPKLIDNAQLQRSILSTVKKKDFFEIL